MLTQRQLQLLRFVHDYLEEHGVCPSFDEMRAALGLKSKSGIHRLVSGLEERGFIRRLAYRARAVEVLKPPPGDVRGRVGNPPRLVDKPEPSGKIVESNIVRGDFRGHGSRRAGEIEPASKSLPLFGRIAAGTPIEAFADTQTMIDVPGLLMGDGEHYVVQVAGDSMIEAGIMDGDYVVIRRCDTAENGSIVVALVEGREVTLKRIRRRGASIALEPANPDYEIRIFGPHQVAVQGKLVGLLRRY
ncbi:MAG: transcriptional repressor LexA [Geminicoccaceae bacterium]|nr:transcriptional repressor LexA [Geminicoccaceae bacterium]MCB2009673.1 transcriptional repressor LexA [Geminicoccaceae bacterium]